MTDVAPSGAIGAPAVEMRSITKRFGSTVACDEIDLDVRAGEIHALLGENGAGKTTLMSILSGFLHADAGSILLDGRPVRIRTPMDAYARGIGMVHQHSALVPTLTVAENVLLGERGLLLRGRDLSAASERLVELGERNRLEVDPDAYVWQLSVGEQQRAEILRALYREARILILDEPTASLTPTEVRPLLDKLRGMADQGAAVVLITHHLDEVMACADRITVLRSGRAVATTSPAETTTRDLARMMVGRDVALAAVLTGDEARAHAGPGADAAPVLEVRGLHAVGARGIPAVQEESFSVGSHEILAVAGVEGNGQSELEELMFGLRRPDGGTIEVEGHVVTGMRPEKLLERGVGFIPSDRYRRGLVRSLSIADNLVVDRIDRPPYGSRFSFRPRAILEGARQLIQRFDIRASSPQERAGALSGGNAQRVVLARVLSSDLRVLIAAQPTRGLDVGATGFVWDQLRAQRDAGVGVLLISTDLDEVFALADRCYVMYRGRLIGPWDRDRFDREEFGLAMGGVSNGPVSPDGDGPAEAGRAEP